MGEQKRRAENELNAERTVSLMHDRLNGQDKVRIQMAAERAAREETGSAGVSNERKEDCPKAVRMCMTVFAVLFAVVLALWLLERFTFLELSDVLPLTRKQTVRILNWALGISLGLTVAFGGLKMWFQRRAWIRRMRQQEAEKQAKQKTDGTS